MQLQNFDPKLVEWTYIRYTSVIIFGQITETK